MTATSAFPWSDLCVPPPALEDVGTEAGPSRGSLDVLVVEDHPAARRALELSLGHLGHLVFTAGTVEEACQLLRGLAVDVVVCDYALPDGDPAALLARWPQAARRVPTIAISGLLDPDLDARCCGMGCDAFLHKPLHIDVLDRTIRRLTRGEG